MIDPIAGALGRFHCILVQTYGFEMLAAARADGVKVGMGVGSGCITQEVKATGRGQATALLEITHARNEYAKRDGIYRS